MALIPATIEIHDLDSNQVVETKQTIIGAYDSKLWIGSLIVRALSRGYGVQAFHTDTGEPVKKIPWDAP